MNKKILLTVFAIIAAAAFISAAQAQINITITVTDAGGHSIGSSIPVNTIIYVHAFYSDIITKASATGVLEVYYNGAATPTATLYNGKITSGQTIIETYNLTKTGTYKLKWTCTEDVTDTNGAAIQCITERGLTSISLTVFEAPEPGTIAGLIMALSAFGLLAAKKAKH
jgi:hypothetical protein